MQTSTINPLKIVIPGEYYDSQIYDGKLYLWGADSSISVLNWNKLVDNINLEDNLKIVLKFALQYGDDLYNNFLFQEPDIQNLIFEKFKKLVKNTIDISLNSLSNVLVRQKDNPLPFPHADSSIHYKTLYVGSQSGISSFSSENQLTKLSKIETKKICDIPVLSLSASHLTLAFAAGSEGLFDYSLAESLGKKFHEPRHISPQNSNFVRWLYPSVFSSSYFDESYFADFKVTRKRRSKNQESSNVAINSQKLFNDSKKTIIRPEIVSSEQLEKENQANTRDFQRLFFTKEIFKIKEDKEIPKITWGTHDKICLIQDNLIYLTKCNPTKITEKKKFINIGYVELEEKIDDVISADSSFFGIVLEKDDGLLIITSTGEYIHLPGEPINWRVFPNSRNYTNQLHVIYEDSIQIYSFNHDFFIDQGEKKIGISFRNNGT